MKQKNAIRAELCELLKQVENNDNAEASLVDTSDPQQERENSIEETKADTVAEFNLNISEAQNPIVAEENLSSMNENEKPIVEETKLAKTKNKKPKSKTTNPPVAADDTMKRSTSPEYFCCYLLTTIFLINHNL